MYPFELLRPEVNNCPECGCRDVERMGRLGGTNRYVCLEGHQFEVPKPPRLLARRRRRREADQQPEGAETRIED